MTTTERLTQGLYTLDANGIVGIYRDCVAEYTDGPKHEYNPAGKGPKAAAAAIAKKVTDLADTKETRIGLAIEAISRCCRDYDKSVKAGLKKIVLSSADHVWPFCNPEYPLLETIDRYWTNAIEIISKVDPKEAAALIATEGREKFAREAAEAREMDGVIIAEFDTQKMSDDELRAANQLKLQTLIGQHPELHSKLMVWLRAKNPRAPKNWEPGWRLQLAYMERAVNPHDKWTPASKAEVEAENKDVPTTVRKRFHEARILGLKPQIVERPSLDNVKKKEGAK